MTNPLMTPRTPISAANALAFPVQPNQILTTGHLWDAFDHSETEVSALWLVMFCQDRGRSWEPFTAADIQSFYDTKRAARGRHSERFLFNRLVEAGRGFFIKEGLVPVGGGWIVENDKQYHFTPDFITRCFSSAPVTGQVEGAV